MFNLINLIDHVLLRKAYKMLKYPPDGNSRKKHSKSLRNSPNTCGKIFENFAEINNFANSPRLVDAI